MDLLKEAHEEFESQQRRAQLQASLQSGARHGRALRIVRMGTSGNPVAAAILGATLLHEPKTAAVTVKAFQDELKALAEAWRGK